MESLLLRTQARFEQTVYFLPVNEINWALQEKGFDCFQDKKGICACLHLKEKKDQKSK